MNNLGLSPIETNADVERGWTGALSDGKVETLMHNTSSVDKLENCGSNVDTISTIASNRIKSMEAEDVDCVYLERAQVEIRDQIEETLVAILHQGSMAASNRIKTASVRFLKTVVKTHSAARLVPSSCRIVVKESQSLTNS